MCLCFRYHIIFLSQICDIPVLDIILYFSFIYHIIYTVSDTISSPCFQIYYHVSVSDITSFPCLVIMLCLPFRYHFMSLFQILCYVFVSDIILCFCFRYHSISLFQWICYVYISDIILCLSFRYHIMFLFRISHWYHMMSVADIISVPCFRYYINSLFQILYYAIIPGIIICFCFRYQQCLWRVRPLLSRVLVGDWDPPLLYHWLRLGVQL